MLQVQSNGYTPSLGAYSVKFSPALNTLAIRVDVRLTDTTFEIFYKNERIASHRRLTGRSGQYSTVQAHMPKEHQQYLEWDGNRFRRWAKEVGPNTYQVINSILTSGRIEQQTYRSCMGVMRLADKHSKSKLEAVCRKALQFTAAPSYKGIKNLFATMKPEDFAVSEYSKRKDNRLKRLIKNAEFEQPDATIAGINYGAGRKLNRDLIDRLSTCEYISEYRNIFIIGAAGSGKTYLACAFGLAACMHYYKVRFVRLPDLLIELMPLVGTDAFAKALKQYTNPRPLIIDEWLLTPLDDDEAKVVFAAPEVIRHRISCRRTGDFHFIGQALSAPRNIQTKVV